MLFVSHIEIYKRLIQYNIRVKKSQPTLTSQGERESGRERERGEEREREREGETDKKEKMPKCRKGSAMSEA